MENKKNFKTTGSRAELVATLQLCIFEKFGAAANDLADGDSGVDKESDGRRRRRKVVSEGAGQAKTKGRGKKQANIVSLHGWEWDATEEFIIERCAASPSYLSSARNVPSRTCRLLQTSGDFCRLLGGVVR